MIFFRLGFSMKSIIHFGYPPWLWKSPNIAHFLWDGRPLSELWPRSSKASMKRTSSSSSARLFSPCDPQPGTMCWNQEHELSKSHQNRVDKVNRGQTTGWKWSFQFIQGNQHREPENHLTVRHSFTDIMWRFPKSWGSARSSKSA